jgi:sec-independent protein translocase protein TatC
MNYALCCRRSIVTSNEVREEPAVASADGSDELTSMSFLAHLEELRRTLFVMLAVAAVCTAAAWFFAERILAVLVTPELGQVHYFGPTEGFMIRVKVSAVTGLMLAFPLLLARLWSFVAPGLFRHERRMVLPILVVSSFLFYFGVAFSYVGVVPKTVAFFMSFASDQLAPMINVTQYFAFVARFCLAFGIVFQLPLVIVMLSATGLVTPQQLWRTWRYGILIIFVFAAWLTPPDAVSQVLLAGPVVVLYLLSMAIAWFVARRRKS